MRRQIALTVLLLGVLVWVVGGGRYSPMKNFMRMAGLDEQTIEAISQLPQIALIDVDWEDRTLLPQKIVVTNGDMTYALIFSLDSIHGIAIYTPEDLNGK